VRPASVSVKERQTVRVAQKVNRSVIHLTERTFDSPFNLPKPFSSFGYLIWKESLLFCPTIHITCDIYNRKELMTDPETKGVIEMTRVSGHAMLKPYVYQGSS
jgi:hypothetical protein